MDRELCCWEEMEGSVVCLHFFKAIRGGKQRFFSFSMVTIATTRAQREMRGMLRVPTAGTKEENLAGDGLSSVWVLMPVAL